MAGRIRQIYKIHCAHRASNPVSEALRYHVPPYETHTHTVAEISTAVHYWR
jgi:hypothetical protein